jgi:hypothetical protein
MAKLTLMLFLNSAIVPYTLLRNRGDRFSKENYLRTIFFIFIGELIVGPILYLFDFAYLMKKFK